MNIIKFIPVLLLFWLNGISIGKLFPQIPLSILLPGIVITIIVAIVFTIKMDS